MPDLGTYSAEVLGAYGVTILLLVGIVVQSVVRSRKVRSTLEKAEGNARDG